jgi:hypothetical protein
MVGTLKVRSTPTGKIGFLRRRVFAFTCLVVCSAAVTAQAALQFDVFLGYDGIVPEASWFPIVCEIKNDGPPFAGVVEVSADAYSRGQTHQVAVELPTGTLKRLVIPEFSASRYQASWDIRLLDERGRVRGEQVMQRPRRQIGWETPLIGGLARTASGAPTLRPILREQADTQSQPAAARLQPSIFPDNPLVLEGMSSLYLSSEVAAKLQVGQVNALLRWLNAGGHLIVGVEQISDVTALAWLRNLLPCEPKEFRTVLGHSEIQEWLRSAGGPTNYPTRFSPLGGGRGRSTSTRAGLTPERPFADLPDDAAFETADLQVAAGTMGDGRVVVAAGGVPLIVTANRGQGKVTVLMFSPEREPFKSWKNLPTFWARLAEVPGNLYVSTDYNPGYGQSADGVFGAMMDSRQVHKLPIWWLLLLLLVYLVVIGPFDRFWLKRIGKPMLTWITFPCYVAAFSLLIYFIGYRLRAGETEWNELHVVDVLRNGDHAELRGRTYASIYSPANARYRVESPQKFATLRGESLGPIGGQTTERVAVFQNGDSFKAEIFVPVWTSQLYISDWWQAAPVPLSVSVSPQGDGWQVTVQNETDRALTQAQLVIAGRVVPLGDVPARQTKTFSATKNQGMTLRDFVQRHGGQFQNAVMQRQHAFGASERGQISDWPNASMAASFVGQLGQQLVPPPGLDLTRVVERGNAVLLAWAADFAPVKPMNQFSTRRSSKQTLWRVAVEIQH